MKLYDILFVNGEKDIKILQLEQLVNQQNEKIAALLKENAELQEKKKKKK